MLFDDFCLRLPHLRIDRAHGPPKPYKPLLLASVVLLIHKGKINSRRVLLDHALRSTFDQLLDKLFPAWPFDAHVEYPFRHLELWRLLPNDEQAALFSQALALKANALAVMKNVVCAELDEDVFAALARDVTARVRVLRLLLETPAYGFPLNAAGTVLELLSAEAPGLDEAAVSAPEAALADLTERAIEEQLHQHWDRTPFAALGIRLADRARDGLPCRQVLTPVNAIDLLGRDATHWWVFELKRGQSGDQVVGQTSRYLGWIQRFHGPARGAILVGASNVKLEYAVRANPGLGLWVYGDGLEMRQVV